MEFPLSAQTLKFKFSPQLSGHDGNDFILTLNSEEIRTSANSQSLVLKWYRSGKSIAIAETVIDRSLTKNYVLIVIDPADEQSQASVSCRAVTFSELKTSPSPRQP